MRSHLQNFHGGELLGGGGMDPDSTEEILVGESLSESHSEALNDLSSIGGSNVNPQHLFVFISADDDLGHAGSAVMVVMGDSPLQGLEAGHHTVHILGTISRDFVIQEVTRGDTSRWQLLQSNRQCQAPEE